MTVRSSPIIVLPGAKGAPDLSWFTEDGDDFGQFEAVSYPDWHRYLEEGFSANALIEDLAAQITSKVTCGPIYVVGISIGGHFGYAAALHLQASGRQIGGFCAIDSFMITSSKASAGWLSRASARGLDLLRNRRIDEFSIFARALFWRALLRLARDHLPHLLRKFGSSRRLPILASNQILEDELSMRLLIREAAPWIGTLDLNPITLDAPAVLMRTKGNAHYDQAWQRRCPNIRVCEIPGDHQTYFDPENIGALRKLFAAATVNWNAEPAVRDERPLPGSMRAEKGR